MEATSIPNPFITLSSVHRLAFCYAYLECSPKDNTWLSSWTKTLVVETTHVGD
jgi:hypothetical protein